MRNLRRFGMALAAGALLVAGSAAAGTDAERQTQGFTAADKFGRGLAAMTTGFLELPGNVVQETRERGPGYGMTLGVAKGLGGIVARELVGVYEFVTSPFAVPDGYRPILRPVYPWGYFDETSHVAARGAERPTIATSDEEL
jgi:putative exosortase-associated protein (TIGR04073 family)